MSLQQAVQSRTPSNGFGHRRADRDIVIRSESKLQSGKPSSGNLNNSGHANGSTGGFETPSRDRLIYVSTCLIGHSVEVQVKNGSIISGIFHATNAEKDFGIVLKMAQVVKNGSLKGQNNVSNAVKRPQTIIVPARELIQVIAKDVLLSGDGLSNGHVRDKRQDLMIDSVISQSYHAEERELERWTPDTDDPQCPELDNIFDGTWNRNWDQFETNEALFGVKSTFDEELYTTKLERGPRMWEIEKEASRIAREIEGEETEDLHLAEERGVHFHEDFDFDEESRFSAVHRGVADGAYEGNENTMPGTRNNNSFPDVSQRKNDDVPQASPSCLQMNEQTSQISAARELSNLGLPDQASLPSSESFSEDIRPLNEESGRGKNTDDGVKKAVSEEPQTSKHEDSCKTSAAQPITSHPHRGSTTSSTPEVVAGRAASAGPGLSPSSSMSSLSLEKSTLNPYAKEFKLNPNAKSFTPSSSLRPQSPVSESSFYYPTGGPALPHMHGLPVGIGMAPTFGGHQPVVYNPPSVHMQSPQPYLHTGAPPYGQQMILGQPRPVMYMPTYPNEMPYKGREF